MYASKRMDTQSILHGMKFCIQEKHKIKEPGKCNSNCDRRHLITCSILGDRSPSRRVLESPAISDLDDLATRIQHEIDSMCFV